MEIFLVLVMGFRGPITWNYDSWCLHNPLLETAMAWHKS